MADTSKLFYQATANHQAGRYPEAESGYLEILKIDQRNIDALRLLGGLYMQMNQPKRAFDYLEKAVSLKPDAEMLNNLGVTLRNLGRLDEARTHYEHALRLKPDYPQAINNLGSLCSERGATDEAIGFFNRSLQVNPNNPQAHYNLGNAFREQGKHVEAIRHYEEALRLLPRYADAVTNLGLALGDLGRLEDAKARHEQAIQMAPQNFRAMNNLGNVLREMGKIEEARVSYLHALAIRPDYDTAMTNLGTVLRDLGRLEESAQQFEKSLTLKPNAWDALINYGTLMLDLNRHEDALGYYNRALREKPDSLDAKWGKALALLALGHYAEGWALHEFGLNHKRGRGMVRFQSQKWDGRNFKGKKLLVWAEQGFGDSLQFVRYAALCRPRGGTVVVMCPEPLARLFRNCPYIDEVVTSAQDGDFDCQISMMSLPHIFETTLDTIPAQTPYLFIDEATRAKWAPRFTNKGGLKIGLVWAGSPREQQINAHLIDKRRSTNLALFKPLFDVEGDIRFYNLQMGKARDQIDELGLHDRITDYMSDVKDFLDTAAIIENLDLVISVDTSVVHLTGGLGKPAWILSRFDACWRWLRNQPRSPWYPKARIFGQAKAGEWSPVIEKISNALAKVAAGGVEKL